MKLPTEEEVLNIAAAHALNVHGLAITPEMAEQVKVFIKEENLRGVRAPKNTQYSPQITFKRSSAVNRILQIKPIRQLGLDRAVARLAVGGVVVVDVDQKEI
ncbi:DUF1059 domain-containing protein [Runella sp. CRIBMP]|uniref:DUF1059 domain-containing protein n=1 Tax=Runella sp. CRIBMP TaxID=2683261 RepID=UPI00286E11E5|nr:DUF1059 domain-containing protein [Runella sp. CRIBMP]